MFILVVVDHDESYNQTYILSSMNLLQEKIEDNLKEWDEVKTHGVLYTNSDNPEHSKMTESVMADIFSNKTPTETIILFDRGCSLTIIAVEEVEGILVELKEWIDNKINSSS